MTENVTEISGTKDGPDYDVKDLENHPMLYSSKDSQILKFPNLFDIFLVFYQKFFRNAETIDTAFLK